MCAIYYLAKHPTVLKKLQEDNMAIKKNKKGDFITSEDVSKMKYTNKVVEETIRMAKFQLLFSERLSGKLSIKDIKYPRVGK
ncbi:hypothetical protein FF1_039056 [Malus domestica]